MRLDRVALVRHVRHPVDVRLLHFAHVGSHNWQLAGLDVTSYPTSQMQVPGISTFRIAPVLHEVHVVALVEQLAHKLLQETHADASVSV